MLSERGNRRHQVGERDQFVTFAPGPHAPQPADDEGNAVASFVNSGLESPQWAVDREAGVLPTLSALVAGKDEQSVFGNPELERI
jgi:hypothetical protein